MKNTAGSILLFFLLLISKQLSAQSPDIKDCYGTDGVLYNGAIYRFYIAPSTTGTPFITGSEFSKGELTVRGKKYHDLALNYDVYNQQLVYQFTGINGGLNMIEISKAWLESFDLSGKHYILISNRDSVARIYQAIGSEKYKVLYYHYKELALSTATTESNMRFTNSIRESYLLKDNNLYRYTNNRSFIRLFEKDKQADIRKYLRQYKIKVRKSDDIAISGLIEYCRRIDT